MASSVDHTGERFAEVLAAFGEVSGDARAAGQLLALLGWDLPRGVDDIGLAGLDLSAVTARLDHLVELRSHEDVSALDLAAATAEVAAAVAAGLDHLAGLAAGLQAAPEYLAATGIVEELFPRLADLLLVQLVGLAAPAGISIGVLLGVVEFTLLPAEPAIFQVRHIRQRVRWDRVSDAAVRPGCPAH